MPAATDGPVENAEVERIQKWREERARVAAEEKAERVRLAQEARAKELAAEEAERRERAKAFLPSGQELEEARAAISRRARRRRRRLTLNVCVIILLPTLLVFAYMARIAVPLFEVRSVVGITTAAPQDTNGLGGILGGATANSRALEKAFMADEYLNSRTMMALLERDTGLVTQLSSDQVDPLRRLMEIPFLGIAEADQFNRFVESSIDIQSGLMTIYVRALSPEDARNISDRVLIIMAAHINSLSDQLYRQRIEQAESDVATARQALLTAQQNLTRLQVTSGEANPAVRIEAIYQTIAQLEKELEAIRTDLAQLRVSGGEGSYQAQRMKELEAAQKERIEAFRNQIFSGDGDTVPLNALLLDHEMATLQVRISEEALTSALGELSQARKDAELGRDQFQVVVPPNASETAAYPDILKAVLITLITTLIAFSLVQMMRVGRGV